MKQHKRGVLIVIVALMWALIVVGLVVEAHNTPEDVGIQWQPAAPLIYTSDGEMSMASGAHALALPGAAMAGGQLNGMMSADGQWLFYMADRDPDDGTGTLMRVAADATVPPVRVDSGVCDAEVSGDGMHVLIIKNIDSSGYCDISYAAMQKDGSAGAPVPIASHTYAYSMAQAGTRVLYVTDETDGLGTLCSWTPGGGAETVAAEAAPIGAGYLPGEKSDCMGFRPTVKTSITSPKCGADGRCGSSWGAAMQSRSRWMPGKSQRFFHVRLVMLPFSLTTTGN